MKNQSLGVFSTPPQSLSVSASAEIGGGDAGSGLSTTGKTSPVRSRRGSPDFARTSTHTKWFFFGLPLACFKYTSLVLRNGIQRKKNFPMLSLSPLLIVFYFYSRYGLCFFLMHFPLKLAVFTPTMHGTWCLLCTVAALCTFTRHAQKQKERVSRISFFLFRGRRHALLLLLGFPTQTRPPPNTFETAAELGRRSVMLHPETSPSPPLSPFKYRPAPKGQNKVWDWSIQKMGKIA